MKMQFYADVYFILNLIMNLFLIMATALIGRKNVVLCVMFFGLHYARQELFWLHISGGNMFYGSFLLLSYRLVFSYGAPMEKKDGLCGQEIISAFYF